MAALETHLEQLFAASTGLCAAPALREAARHRRAGVRLCWPKPHARCLVDIETSVSEDGGSKPEGPDLDFKPEPEPEPEGPEPEGPEPQGPDLNRGHQGLCRVVEPETEGLEPETPDLDCKPEPERPEPDLENPQPRNSPRPASRTSSRGDAETRLRQALTDLGVPPGLVDDLAAASVACATVEAGGSSLASGPDGAAGAALASTAKARAQGMLSAVEAVTVLSCRMDGVRLAATRQLTAEMGKLLLADKGVADPGELSKTARGRWRARAKSVTRHELEAATGWGAGEVINLVGLANAPAAVRGPVHQALARGEASWQLARAYFRATSSMAHEHAAAIANGLFGDDPQDAVTERLTREGEWLGTPWRAKEFHRTLEREVHKIKNQDPDEAKEARNRAQHHADVRVTIDREGTAEILIGTRPAHAAAVADRIERLARAARKAGDPRTLRQLRSAAAMALLLHGTLDFSGISDDPHTITVEQSDQLTKLLYGLPAAHLQVVVPCEAIFGTLPVLGNDAGAAGAAAHDTVRAHADPDVAGVMGELCLPPPEPLPGSRPHAVGEVIGRHSAFLDSGELWELLLTPGSVFHRLLVDPVTGRCVDKSAKGYRFTARQREQIVAADVFCRAPGCLQPAWLCQIDHVQEHGTTGGDTSEANGHPLHEPHHDLKTKKLWDAVINDQRDVTWTSMLGRIYATTAHDYRQYTRLLTAATEFVAAPERADTAQGVANAPVDDAIYRALSYRPVGADLLSNDDWIEDDEAFYGWPLITLTHRDAKGRRVFQPDPAAVAEARRAHEAATSPDANGSAARADTAGGPAETEGPDTTDWDPSLLDGIDISLAVDLTKIDVGPTPPDGSPPQDSPPQDSPPQDSPPQGSPPQSGPPQDSPHVTDPELPADDPFGPGRYLPWTTDDDEPPF